MRRRRSNVPDRVWEVTEVWGGNVQRSEVFAAPFEVTIGDAKGADLPLALEGLHVLLRADDMGTVLCAPSGARGVIAAPSGTIELGGETSVDIPLGEDGRAILEIAGMEILVRATDAPEKIAAATPFSWREHRFTAASLAFHLAFLLGVVLVPPHAMSLSLDRESLRSRIAEIALAPAEEELPEWASEIAAPVQGTNEGQPMAGDQGEAGDPKETARDRQMRIKGRPDNERPLVPRLSAEQVTQSGILGILNAGAFSPTGSIYGAEGAEGRDPVTLIGNLHANEFGSAFGSGGFGPAGTGRGGCPAGTPPELCAYGTVGIGRTGMLGSIGGCSAERIAALTREVGRARAVEMCSGGHRGVGIGDPRGGGGRQTKVPGIFPREVTLAGGLSKEAIRRTVQRHMNEIRFCYEQGLRSEPDLEGRVAVRFVVRPDGAVLSAAVATSTLQSARVETCMAGAVRRWAFPQADNGGTTVVTYPFVVVPAPTN